MRQRGVTNKSLVLGLAVGMACAVCWASYCDGGIQPGCVGRQVGGYCYCQGQQGQWAYYGSEQQVDFLCTGYLAGMEEICKDGEPCNMDERWEYTWEKWQCEVPGGPKCKRGCVRDIDSRDLSIYCCGEAGISPTGLAPSRSASAAWRNWLNARDCGCG